MIEELLARCPDRATESVLADWCEENRRAFLVKPLRSEDDAERGDAVAHLGHTFVDAFSLEKFQAAQALLGRLDRHWRHIATNLERFELADIYFVASYKLFRDTLDEVTRARAIETVACEPCATCGHPAPLVGIGQVGVEPDGAAGYYTELATLCLFGPHISQLRRTNSWYTSLDPR